MASDLGKFSTRAPGKESKKFKKVENKLMLKEQPKISKKAERKMASLQAIDFARAASAVMEKVEYKRPIPQFKGSDAPSCIEPPFLGYRLNPTKEYQLMQDSMRKLFGDKHYEFRLSTALNMSSSAGGAVNSTIAISALQFITDFVALGSVFNEFFVNRVHIRWMPVSRYNYPLSATTTTMVANLPIGVASLQHAQAAYTSLAVMADNYHISFDSTGDPFHYTWVNAEKSSSTVVSASSGATQSWCDTSNSANYTGMIQFLSQSAPPALPASQVLGVFLCYWDVMFRLRA